MTSYEVYNLYLSIKFLHFTSDTYDYFKHNAKVNSSMNTFLKRNDRFFFHKLNTKYTKDEIIDYFISNFFASSKTWIGNLIRADGETTYNKFKKYQQSFKYSFRNDCVSVNNDVLSNNIHFDDVFSVDDGQHLRLFDYFFLERSIIQSFIIFDQILSFSKRWDKQIKETIIWIRKIFQTQKTKTIY